MFTPVGDVSRRQQVIELASTAKPGDLLTYDSLQQMLGCDLETVRSAVNQAKPGCQRELQKSLVAVRNEGYLVALPEQHLDIAKTHQRKGRRQTKKSLSAVEHTDYSQLSESDRTRFDIAVGVIRVLETWERRADLRYSSREKLDEFILSQSDTNDRTSSDVANLKQRLARVESLVKTAPQNRSDDVLSSDE